MGGLLESHGLSRRREPSLPRALFASVWVIACGANPGLGHASAGSKTLTFFAASSRGSLTHLFAGKDVVIRIASWPRACVPNSQRKATSENDRDEDAEKRSGQPPRARKRGSQGRRR